MLRNTRNRHLGKNVRILLVNNGRGVIFRKPGNMGSMFGEETDEYISAAGHFGGKKESLVRDFAKNLGFQYFCASTKEEFKENVPQFLNPRITEAPMVFECFTDVSNEIEGDKIFPSNIRGVHGMIHGVLGDSFYDKVRTIIKGKGQMGVDIGKNK